MNPSLSFDLPAFLVEEGGLNSGLMMIHVTAAALVSEGKTNAFPASVDSIPTSAGKEDHVSMGPIAARKLARNVEILETVLAIELLAAAQALDLRRPLRSSPILEEAHERLRAKVPFWVGGPPRGAGHRRGAGGPVGGSRRPPRPARLGERVRERGRQLRGREAALPERPAGEARKLAGEGLGAARDRRGGG